MPATDTRRSPDDVPYAVPSDSTLPFRPIVRKALPFEETLGDGLRQFGVVRVLHCPCRRKKELPPLQNRQQAWEWHKSPDGARIRRHLEALLGLVHTQYIVPRL